jgi:hypothetical protein
MRNRCPAPRKAEPLRTSSQLVGSRVQSKLRSSTTTLPTTPASEFTPKPIINRPVCVSLPST